MSFDSLKELISQPGTEQLSFNKLAKAIHDAGYVIVYNAYDEIGVEGHWLL